MMTLIAGMAAAGWLGILTSISPCPLATNIAAVSYLGRRMHSRRMAVAGAVAYATGRAAVYVILGLIITWGLSNAPALSNSLQNHIGPFLGPLLILVALVLLGWIELPVRFGVAGQSTATRLAGWGLAGEFFLGALFALTFCPVSAALFFGALLPMAIAAPTPLPALAFYGFGTALPVGVLAIALAFGMHGSSKMISAIQKSRGLLGNITGGVLLLVGIYLTLTLSLGWPDPVGS